MVPLEKALESDESKSLYGLHKGNSGVERATTALNYLNGLLNEQVEVFNSEVSLPYEDSEATVAIE